MRHQACGRRPAVRRRRGYRRRARAGWAGSPAATDPPAGRVSLLTQLRALAMGLAAACAGGGLYDLQVIGRETRGWWLLLGGAAARRRGAGRAALSRAPSRQPPPAPTPRRGAGRPRRCSPAPRCGRCATSAHLPRTGPAGFDFAWMGWTSAVRAARQSDSISPGARWPRPAGARWGAGMLLAMAVLLAVAAVLPARQHQGLSRRGGDHPDRGSAGRQLRLGVPQRLPAALGVPQQHLAGGARHLAGRPVAVRHARAVRRRSARSRCCRCSSGCGSRVGTAGALVGTALLACSFWDVVLSRIPNNHNALIVSIVFALLAGPVRRGRPSAYVLLGFFGGYILHEYIAYRPLAAFALAGAVAVVAARPRRPAGTARVARPLITVVLLVSDGDCRSSSPAFPGRLRPEYFDGWNRAHGIAGYYNPNDTWAQCAAAAHRPRAADAAELFTVHGDRSPVRNITGQPPLIDPVTCALLVLGIAGAAANLLRPVLRPDAARPRWSPSAARSSSPATSTSRASAARCRTSTRWPDSAPPACGRRGRTPGAASAAPSRCAAAGGRGRRCRRTGARRNLLRAVDQPDHPPRAPQQSRLSDRVAARPRPARRARARHRARLRQRARGPRRQLAARARDRRLRRLGHRVGAAPVGARARPDVAVRLRRPQHRSRSRSSSRRCCRRSSSRSTSIRSIMQARRRLCAPARPAARAGRSAWPTGTAAASTPSIAHRLPKGRGAVQDRRRWRPFICKSTWPAAVPERLYRLTTPAPKHPRALRLAVHGHHCRRLSLRPRDLRRQRHAHHRRQTARRVRPHPRAAGRRDCTRWRCSARLRTDGDRAGRSGWCGAAPTPTIGRS